VDPGLSRFIRHSAFFFLGLTLGIIVIVKLWPASEILLFAEDGIIEYGTAVVDGLAALLGFYALGLVVLRGKPPVERIVLLTIPLLSLFCALDEISWGARLFDLQMPEIEGGGEFDGVHDVFLLLERWATAEDMATLSMTLAIVSSLLGLLLYWQRGFVADCLAFAVHHPLGRPVACAILLLALATGLDFAHGRIIYSLEEYSELSAGLLMFAAAWESVRMAKAGLRPDLVTRPMQSATPT
jgi:hypothetical protein